MKPYRKPHYKESAERDYLLAWGASFLVGAMLGATLVMGVMAL